MLIKVLCCRSKAGGGAAGVGRDANQTEAFAADAFQEDIHDGQESWPRKAWPM